MEGIGLENMLSAEQVEKLFSDEAPQASEPAGTEEADASSTPENENQEEAAEVDFSDLLGNNQPESVGSDSETEGVGETSASSKGQGTPPTNNLFSSIAKAIMDEGVFPDLSDSELKSVTDAASLKQMFDDQVSKMLTERQRRLEDALNGGATTEELRSYQEAMNISQFLEERNTLDTLNMEGEAGDRLRKQVMYQDYKNRGFKDERIQKLIQKSFDDGTDIEDAKEALESCKEFYKGKVQDYQDDLEARKQESRANEERQYASLKKKILDTENFFDGVKVDKGARQRAYDAITKPVYKDEQGNYLTALQKYQRENPIDFMVNMALMMTLTDNFKNVEKLTKTKVKAGLKKGFAELESVLNSSRRNSDGTLNLANGYPGLEDRENWSLA